MGARPAEFELRLARDRADLEAVQTLRYAVFVEEMGGDGPLVDHCARIEADRFDPHCDHLMLFERGCDGQTRLAGTSRIMDRRGAARAGGFYSAAEFDLTPILDTDAELLELGRSCLGRAHRGGTAMHHLWLGLARVALARGTGLLFGTASFAGIDRAGLTGPLSLLHHAHLAPEALRVRSRQAMTLDLLPPDRIDRRAARLATPALIKAYLRLGGVVGEGVYVDRDFNTTDICMVLDLARMDPIRRAAFERGAGA